MNTRCVKIYAVLWWDEDHRDYGCPITIAVHTRKKFYYIRPFAKSQSYDWAAGRYTGSADNHWDDIVWKHIVSSPADPEIWETLEKKRLNVRS